VLKEINGFTVADGKASPATKT
jgi:hypothetical protein